MCTKITDLNSSRVGIWKNWDTTLACPYSQLKWSFCWVMCLCPGLISRFHLLWLYRWQCVRVQACLSNNATLELHHQFLCSGMTEPAYRGTGCPGDRAMRPNSEIIVIPTLQGQSTSLTVKISTTSYLHAKLIWNYDKVRFPASGIPVIRNINQI